MFERKQLIRFDQPAERHLDQFLAFLQVVEDLSAEDEETTIDPKIGILVGAEAVDLPARFHIDEMQAERWAHS